MTFKDPHLADQFIKSSMVLQQIVADFFNYSKREFNIEPVITRLWDPVEGESGVHPDKRGCDIRDEHGGEFVFTTAQSSDLQYFINEKWKRNDGFRTCIHHGFRGGPKHFHLQISVNTKTYETDSSFFENVSLENLTKKESTMEKAYDLKDLGSKLKEKGLDLAEDAAGIVLDATMDWLGESAIKSENKIDDILVPLLMAVKPYIKDQIDKIDGKEG